MVEVCGCLSPALYNSPERALQASRGEWILQSILLCTVLQGPDLLGEFQETFYWELVGHSPETKSADTASALREAAVGDCPEDWTGTA